MDQYYAQIYDYLTKGLDSNIICQLTGICPAPGKMQVRIYFVEFYK